MPVVLQEKLKNDLKDAMKSGDSFVVGVLRMVVSALNNTLIEKRGKGLPEELTDDEARAALSKEMKKRRDAIALYEQGGRADLAEQEKKEAALIQKYFPAQIGREEIEKVIDQILSKSDFDNFGEAMKAVMAELKGTADGKIVSEILRQKFEK